MCIIIIIIPIIIIIIIMITILIIIITIMDNIIIVITIIIFVLILVSSSIWAQMNRRVFFNMRILNIAVVSGTRGPAHHGFRDLPNTIDGGTPGPAIQHCW